MWKISSAFALFLALCLCGGALHAASKSEAFELPALPEVSLLAELGDVEPLRTWEVQPSLALEGAEPVVSAAIHEPFRGSPGEDAASGAPLPQLASAGLVGLALLALRQLRPRRDFAI